MCDHGERRHRPHDLRIELPYQLRSHADFIGSLSSRGRAARFAFCAGSFHHFEPDSNHHSGRAARGCWSGHGDRLQSTIGSASGRSGLHWERRWLRVGCFYHSDCGLPQPQRRQGGRAKFRRGRNSGDQPGRPLRRLHGASGLPFTGLCARHLPWRFLSLRAAHRAGLCCLGRCRRQ